MRQTRIKTDFGVHWRIVADQTFERIYVHHTFQSADERWLWVAQRFSGADNRPCHRGGR
jgi:hypothetical protein